jgi:hypothetical protein
MGLAKQAMFVSLYVAKNVLTKGVDVECPTPGKSENSGVHKKLSYGL